jgi:hypothetical protein
LGEKRVLLGSILYFFDSLFLVFVNGNPSGFFSSSCCLRQGDPLSPYLLVIMMEALSRMIYASVNGGFLTCFFVGSRLSGLVNISHLLFADDTLVFCGAKPDHLCNPHALYLCFEVASRLKINLDKSKMVPMGIVENVDELAGILGSKVSSLPLKYLGLSLGVSFKAKSI